MNKKVLIVDDDPGIIEVLSIIMSDQGYDIKAIDDDSELFEAAREFKPDVILLDVWMPGLGGKEICRRFKTFDWSKKIPIVIISASVNIEKVSQECGADGYVTKPFEMSDLVKTVDSYLRATR